MNNFESINPGPEHTTPKPEKESRPSKPESVENKNNTQEQPLAQPRQEEPVSQNSTEIEVVNGQQYHVEYVPREDIYPAYGYGGGNSAIVRQDLQPSVKKFVKAHELYHCQDKSDFGGWFGREIRANIIPGLKDPIGLAATVWKTITDVDRIKFYLKRIKEGH